MKESLIGLNRQRLEEAAEQFFQTSLSQASNYAAKPQEGTNPAAASSIGRERRITINGRNYTVLADGTKGKDLWASPLIHSRFAGSRRRSR